MKKILSFVLAIAVTVSGIIAVTCTYSKGLSPPFTEYGKKKLSI